MPPGFCILTSAYNSHIKSLNIYNSISKDILSSIQSDIIKKPLDEELKKHIKKHYSLFKPKMVAVRSSATAEDMRGHSFAGQYDTYLNISTPEDCILAVKKCWASLWNERVFEYRKKYGISYKETAMSVIVQEMVEAEQSGVIFTVDPRGRKDRIIIETCSGLGEKLVSGRTSPDRIILNKINLNLIEKSIKKENINFINENTLKKLAKEALKIEKIFSCPQDIEWSKRGNNIYFLQTRPITKIEDKNTYKDYIWTNANTGEVLPDVVSPITWSMVKIIIKAIFKELSELIGIDMDKVDTIGLIGGRVYFNLNMVTCLFKQIPGLKDVKFSEFIGGLHEKIPEISTENIPIKVNFMRIILKIPSLLLWGLLHQPDKGLKSIEIIKNKIELLRIEPTSLTDEEIFEHFKLIFTTMSSNSKYVPYVGTGMNYFYILKNICKKWIKDNDSSIFNRLVTAIGGLDSAESGLFLWKIAIEAEKNNFLKKAVLSENNFKELKQKLINNCEGKNFLSLWDEFMKNHGHHARGEIELINPRWHEMPDYILEKIKNYMGQIEEINPIGDYEKKASDRKSLIQDIKKKLNPLQSFIFDYILLQVQSGLKLRENLKSEMVKYLAIIRTILLEIGKRLKEKGIFENSEDIFFIELEELEGVAKGNINPGAIIRDRRKTYEKNIKIIPPPVVVGSFDPEHFIQEEYECNREILSGLPVSSGIVTGIAKVILKSDNNEKISPGEILVAPFTDPGWTPYFISARGIVMDMGGMLSHGSIVARELGIPAVVNVGPATKIIRTGDKIKVDGNKGTVMIFRWD